MTVSGTRISLGQSGVLVIDTSSIILGSSALIVGGYTLIPGELGIPISRTQFSLAQSDIADVGTSAKLLVTPPSVSIGQQLYAVKPIGNNDFAVGGYTLTPGEPPVTVSGTRISLGQSGVLVINTSSINLSPTAGIDLGRQTYAFDPVDPIEIVVAGSTLTANGAGIVVSGTPVSLGQSDILVVGSSSIDLAPRPTIIIGSQTYMPNEPNPSEGIGAGSTPISATVNLSNSRINNIEAAPFNGESAAWGPGLLQMMIGFGIAVTIHWK